jgi:hypothetical protein
MAQDTIGAGILAIERPHRHLLWLYVIRAVLTGPGFIVAMPLLFFRYETMQYRFDAEGIHMRWGILFRRQINLTEFEAVRDFLYTRMRGYRDRMPATHDEAAHAAGGGDGGQVAALLRDAIDELRAIRIAFERQASHGAVERRDV